MLKLNINTPYQQIYVNFQHSLDVFHKSKVIYPISYESFSSNVNCTTHAFITCKLCEEYTFESRLLFTWKAPIFFPSLEPMLFQIWFFYPQVSFKRVISFPGVVRSNSIMLIAIIQDVSESRICGSIQLPWKQFTRNIINEKLFSLGKLCFHGAYLV